MALYDPAAFAPPFSVSRHITKPRLLVALSLALTWWLASLLPTYTPALRASLSSRFSEARQKIPSIKVDFTPSPAFSPHKLALLIEPRPFPHLAPHILHMMSVVPPSWRFLFVGTNASVLAVRRAPAIQHRLVTGKLDLVVLPEPWSVASKEDVYRTMTDLQFYDEFLPGVEWILKYESDSILCANSGESLDDWLHWSWAGAPRKENDRFAGNGGLSLRRVSAIRRVLAFQERYNDTEPEDEWFGKRLWVLPGERVAAGDDGVLAVEDVFYERPMGFHVRGGRELADGVWKGRERRRGLFEYCPELSLIMEMKLEVERCEADNLKGGIKGAGEKEGKGKEEEKQDGEGRKGKGKQDGERRKGKGTQEAKMKQDEEKGTKKDKADAGKHGPRPGSK